HPFFREIFKNAFLPYRSPETLKLFLKTINEFNYDHSENLGNAYEYLLSILGTQGDAGQFRTPRHIIDFIVKVIDPQKHETILDPACGTAGFLLAAYKHILSANTNKTTGDKLTPDDRNRLATNLTGYDIDPNMERFALVNMFLHGFVTPQIHEYDTLSSQDRWNEYYDVILANPPFMSPKGGIRPHTRFSVKSNRSEVLFVDYIAEHLAAGGRAGVIVPEGIIFQSGTAYKSLRKMLVAENYLVGVISLPAGVFNPYSGVKTSILWLDKTLAKKTDKILFVKISSDGFDLGAQRRSVKENDLTDALINMIEFKQDLIRGKELNLGIFPNFSIIAKSKIIGNGDYSLSGERYKIVGMQTSSYPFIPLKEIVEINPGKSELKRISNNTEVSFVPMHILNENASSFYPQEKRKISEVITGYTYFQNEDVLLAKITPCFENGKAGIARNIFNSIGFGSTEFFILRSKGKILPELLYRYLTTESFREIGKKNMTGSAGQQRIPKGHL
ncbi:MAG: N-6 DNA methylase, partial [Bacteroidota bacterium]